MRGQICRQLDDIPSVILHITVLSVDSYLTITTKFHFLIHSLEHQHLTFARRKQVTNAHLWIAHLCTDIWMKSTKQNPFQNLWCKSTRVRHCVNHALW